MNVPFASWGEEGCYVTTADAIPNMDAWKKERVG